MSAEPKILMQKDAADFCEEMEKVAPDASCIVAVADAALHYDVEKDIVWTPEDHEVSVLARGRLGSEELYWQMVGCLLGSAASMYETDSAAFTDLLLEISATFTQQQDAEDLAAGKS